MAVTALDQLIYRYGCFHLPHEDIEAHIRNMGFVKKWIEIPKKASGRIIREDHPVIGMLKTLVAARNAIIHQTVDWITDEGTLSTAVREATDGATGVYVFEGSRCVGDKRLNYEAFVSEKNRAGADLLKIMNRLRHLLHTVPQGRVNGLDADGHIAEFNFRHHYRKGHSSYIADRLLEHILKPLDHTFEAIELLD